jgi:hypothetical protein
VTHRHELTRRVCRGLPGCTREVLRLCQLLNSVQLKPFYAAVECFLRDYLTSWVRGKVSGDIEYNHQVVFLGCCSTCKIEWKRGKLQWQKVVGAPAILFETVSLH